MEPHNESATNHPSESVGKKTILLIDDSVDMLLLNSTVLGLAGYRVLTASSGNEALRLLAFEEQPDLILLDMMMDEMSGEEFMEVFEKNCPELFAKVPVVFLTGLDEVPATAAVGVIRKPVDVDKFLQLVGMFLNSRADSVATHH